MTAIMFARRISIPAPSGRYPTEQSIHAIGCNRFFYTGNNGSNSITVYGRVNIVLPSHEKQRPVNKLQNLPRPQRQQLRSFRSTSIRPIAPFLPEIVIAAGIIGGWVVYRKSLGKPLTPDDAIGVQEAYHKQEEERRRRQARWKANRARATHPKNNAHEFSAEKWATNVRLFDRCGTEQSVLQPCNHTGVLPKF